MSTSALGLRFDEARLWVDLADGRCVAVPLAWFPKLLKATTQEREDYELSARGIHWNALDEDISVDGLLAGVGDQTRRRSMAVA